MTIQKERKKRKLPNGFTSSKPVQKLVSNWFSLDDTDDDLPIKQPIEMVQEYFPQEILGVKVMFPYVPYQSQLDLMKNIILSIENGQNAILESPTGTGKTLSILCSSLSWLEQAKQKRLEELSKRRLDFQKLAESLASLPELNECTKLNNVESDKSVIKENTSGVHGSESSRQETGGAIEPESFRIPKIYITSRTQKQIHQTVSELKSRCQVKPKVSILASREYLCIHHDVKKSSNKNEDCQALKEQGNCIYAQNEKRLAMKDALPEIWDIEDIVTAGKKLQACPYYAARNLSKSADVVFAPYNYIVDPLIRNSMDMELEDSVLIVDEAHNIEQMSMDAASAEISEIEIREVLRVLKVYGKGMGDQSYLFETKDLTKLVNTILNWIQQYKSKGFPLKELNKTFRLWTGNEIHKSLKAEGISFSLLSQLEKSVAQLSTPSVVELPKSNMVKEQIKFPSHAINTLQKLILSLQYVFQETPDNRNEFKVLLSKSYQEDWKVRREFGDYQFALHFWCLNAGVVFSNLGNLCRSVILTSGTLSPIVSYAKELGVHFEHTLEAPHVIPDENLWVGSISSGPDRSPLCGVFANFETDQYQDQLGLSILKLGKRIPNGVLVFFPSYSWIDKLMDRWTSTNLISHLQNVKHIFQEPKTNSKGVLEQLMCEYDEKASGSGAFMFAVYRGKMSEGIDFSDQRARGVICIGLPFPSIKNLRVKEKRVYNNAFYKPKSLLTGNEWYEMQAFRALNQALGRCIRHRNDWGAIILLDSRFSTNSPYIELLPMWIRNRVDKFTTLLEAEKSLTVYVETVEEKYQQQLLEEKSKIISTQIADIEAKAESVLVVEEAGCTNNLPSTGDLNAISKDPPSTEESTLVDKSLTAENLILDLSKFRYSNVLDIKTVDDIADPSLKTASIPSVSTFREQVSVIESETCVEDGSVSENGDIVNYYCCTCRQLLVHGICSEVKGLSYPGEFLNDKDVALQLVLQADCIGIKSEEITSSNCQEITICSAQDRLVYNRMVCNSCGEFCGLGVLLNQTKHSAFDGSVLLFPHKVADL